MTDVVGTIVRLFLFDKMKAKSKEAIGLKYAPNKFKLKITT